MVAPLAFTARATSGGSSVNVPPGGKNCGVGTLNMHAAWNTALGG